MSEKITRPPRTDDPEDLRDFLEQVERQLNLVGTTTVNVGNIVAGETATFTISVIGCRLDRQQAVVLAAPSAIETNLIWCGFVSADDVVTVRLTCASTIDINPASATWGARVFL